MSLLNLTKFGTDYSFAKLREPVNKTDWITHSRPAVVNAFYNSLENSIREYSNVTSVWHPLLGTQRKNRDIIMSVVSANSLIPQRLAPEYTMSSLNKQEILIL